MRRVSSGASGLLSRELPPSQPESVDASGGDFSDALLFGGSGSLGEGVSAQVLEAVQCSVSPVHSPGRDRNGSVGSVGSEPGVASGSPLDTVPPFSPATLRRVSLARIASSDSVDIPTTPHDEDRRVLRRTLVGPSSLPPPSLRPALGDADTGTPQLARESAEALLVDTPEAAASGPPAAADGQDGTAGAAEARDGGSVSSPSAPRMAPDDFEILSLVGQGAFGKVFQVQQRTTGRIYAMKVMKKAAILEKNQAEYMRTERDVLTRVDHPFVVTLRFSFQTVGKLYLVLDFINGGHLFFQLYRHGIFEEALARTYTAELVLALAHLHSLGIAHRDLKPENILLDAAGHIRVTDFGLAKLVAPGARFNSLVGTVEYMAPEIVAGRGHGMAADWWSVGILLFEMLTGQPPFRSKNRGALQKKILTDKIKYPTFLSAPAHKLLSALLQREEAKRLGSGADGAAAIQRHDFFKGVNWRKLLAREVDAPFRPAVADERCTANFDELYTKMPALDSPTSTPELAASDPFKGFTYSRSPAGLALLALRSGPRWDERGGDGDVALQPSTAVAAEAAAAAAAPEAAPVASSAQLEAGLPTEGEQQQPRDVEEAPAVAPLVAPPATDEWARSADEGSAPVAIDERTWEDVRAWGAPA